MIRMEKLPQVDFQELADGITKAGQKIIQNYLENRSGYHHDNRDIANAYSQFGTKLMASPKEMEKVQLLYQSFLTSQQELWKRISERQFDKTKEYTPVIKPADNDKRFRAPEWDEAPYYFDFVKQSYLLVSTLMKGIIETSEIDEKSKKKLNFYSQHYVDALSPSNFVATNPEAIKLAY